ncbi:transcriptional regulator [Clostridium aceticum]|uniref:Transcriptional regulator n=1 Tax=Clostridium aceticum TaxID=84022 RepID=A0A0G3W7B5_9CLOT|nr:TetR/AcrR family transcriptional regulator [Clostridium aceticum]AKL94243.1 transcriptional regulator [Clostridium aceticum]
MIDKKEIQKRRIMSYFIEATNKVIEEEGIEAITVRKVADLAGYNSATMYNYFENLDHLIFFASMKYLKEYAIELPEYIKGAEDSLDKYLRIWKCFCTHSYNNPKIYQLIFFEKFCDSLRDSIKEYYNIFPEELGEQPEELLPMLLKQNIPERNLPLLKTCAKDGFLQDEYLDEVNEMTLVIYQGMFTRVLKNQVDYSIDVAVDKTLLYIKKTIEAYGGALNKCNKTSILI